MPNTTFDLNDPRLTAYALGELHGDELAGFESIVTNTLGVAEICDDVRKTSEWLRLQLISESSPMLTTVQRRRLTENVSPRRYESAQSSINDFNAVAPQTRSTVGDAIVSLGRASMHALRTWMTSSGSLGTHSQHGSAIMPRERWRHSNRSSIPAMIAILEPRILLSATDDAAALDASTLSVNVDILANDDLSARFDEIATLDMGGVYGGVSIDAYSGHATYTLGPIRGLGAFTGADNDMNNLITQWGAQEHLSIDITYATAVAALNRLGTFLNGFSFGTDWLAASAGAVGTIGGAVGFGVVEIGGLIVGTLAAAAQANEGQAFSIILNAAA